MQNRTLCVTGHRPDKLSLCKADGLARFISGLDKVIDFCMENSFTHFIAGGALGADTYFAERVIAMRQKRGGITLEIAVPCASQSLKWSEENRKRYDEILRLADKVTVLGENYTPYCMQKRNEYMVDKSDCVLCCYCGSKSGGTYNTIIYAQRKKKDLIYLPVGIFEDDFSQTNIFDGSITFVKKII